jgi:hypothetical protein
VKTVVSFLPPRRFADSERHYVSTHVPIAARAFEANPGCFAYHTLRASRELAATGRFDHRLTAYRFTEIWYTDEHPPTPSPEVAHFFDTDVPFCIREMRRFIVTEETVLERPSAAGSPAHYLIEADSAGEGDGGRTAFRRLMDAVLATPKAASVRRAWINWVDDENLIDDGPEAGQRHTPLLLDSTTKVAFAFLVLDNARVAEDFFAQAGVVEALLADDDLEVRVLELSRTVELDKSGRSAT